MKDFPQFGGVRILCDVMGQSECFTGVFTQGKKPFFGNLGICLAKQNVVVLVPN